jgi:hypothetical protein
MPEACWVAYASAVRPAAGSAWPTVLLLASRWSWEEEEAEENPSDLFPPRASRAAPISMGSPKAVPAGAEERGGSG